MKHEDAFTDEELSALALAVADEAPPPPKLKLEWQDLHPFTDTLMPVEDYRSAMLPKAVREWVADVAESMDNAPIDFAAVTLLVGAGALIGRKVGIMPKRYGDWCVIPNVWGLCIQSPGVKKTPIQKAILSAIDGFERDARKEYESELDLHEADIKLARLQEKATEDEAKKLLKDKDGGIEKARVLLQELSASEPVEPVCRRYIMHDATVEKVAELLAENPAGLLQCRDEISGWLRSLDREDRANDRSFYLEAWNGTGSYSYDRIGRGSKYIPYCVLSVIGNIQPGKLAPYLRDRKTGDGDDGLVERFQLAVYPDKPTPCRIDREPNHTARAAAVVAMKALRDIPLGEDTTCLRFDSRAQTVFDEWYDQLLARQNTIEPWLEAHISKYASLMPSIALIYHLLDGRGLTEVSEAAAVVAAAWCEYLESHARRIYGLCHLTEVGARSLAANLHKLGNPFTAADFRNREWTGLKSGEERQQALSDLVARGYLAAREVETEGRSRTDYYKNPALNEA